MANKWYDLREYAQSRLNGTFVTYKGKAFYVDDVDDDLCLLGHTLSDGKHYVVDQEDNELVIASPQVGYVNLPETALYFMRAPARRWKQGLDMRALVCPRGGMRARGMLTNEALVRCIENNYPSFEQAQGMFKSANPFKEHQREGVAFHRDFALRRGPEGMLLCHKGTEVGVVEQGNPVLSMKYGWLTEKLEGVLG